jgi:F0F1-type ATP synthase assembly protein I
MPRNNGNWMTKAGVASSIGLMLVVATVIGYGLGLLLKRVFNTGDWIVFVCLMLGIVAGFVEMIRTAISLSNDDDRKS